MNLPLIAAGIFDFLLFVVWPGHYLYAEFLCPRFYPHRYQRQRLKELLGQLRYRYRWDRDLLNQSFTEQFQAVCRDIEALLALPPPPEEDVEPVLNRGLTLLNKMSTATKNERSNGIRDLFAVVLVVFCVVMGIRTLFLQPFKIPTGSMQPTLFGIHFTELKKSQNATPPIWRKVLDYVNFSRRYVDLTVKEDGYIQGGMHSCTPLGPISRIFLPETEVMIGRHRYQFPGKPKTVMRYLINYQAAHYPDEGGFFFKGQTLVRGHLQLGDHLFVDRIRYNFTEPKRGDIVVFITDGLKTQNGQALNGKFYIKRLVGLPGDELRITKRHLYVRTPGSKKFRLVDERDNPAFKRIYSFKGGYKGYSHPNYSSAQYLLTDQDTFQLGKDQYFMMGDNTENSLDSRYWGTVPRKNIVGCALLVYWPFLRHWGLADHVEPENFPTP